MARKIKFRARLLNGQEWVYGSLIQSSLRWGSKYEIRVLAEDEESDDKTYEVYFPTIGQYTGLKDRNGKEIYEGDIVVLRDIAFVKFVDSGIPGSPDEVYEDIVSEVTFDSGYFCVDYQDQGTSPLGLYTVTEDVEVIGNIYENPELYENLES